MQRQPRTNAHPLSLEVLHASHPLRPQVLRLDVLPAQERFVLPAATTLPQADADPGRTPFAVLLDGPGGLAPVGFGVLDRGGYLPELLDAPERAVLLRAFYVDTAHQGQGIGTRAARAVRRLAGRLDGVELVALTVNVANTPGVAAYRRAGYADTGTFYLRGDAGPQHVLVAAVSGTEPPKQPTKRAITRFH